MKDSVDVGAMLSQGRGARKTRRWIIAGAVIAAVAGGAFWVLLAPPASPEAGVSYRTAAVTMGDVTVTVTATGTVDPSTQVDVSSEISGTLSSVLVDFNESVTKGEVLATLDTTQLDAALAVSRANVAAAEASVASAKATLDEAKIDYETTSNLADRGVTTSHVLASAQATLTRAEASVAQAEANLQVAEANVAAQEAELEKATITSPIDGVVLDVEAEPGQIVAASLSAPTLFTLAGDLSTMQLGVDVAEADIGLIHEGDTAVFTVEAYDDISFPAAITQIRYASETTDGLVTYTAILSVENPDLLLRPGMTAVADITVAEARDAMLVPNAALRYAPPDPGAPPETSGSGSGGAAPNSGGLFGMIMPGPRGGPGGQWGGAPEDASSSDGKSVWVLDGDMPRRVDVEPGETDGTHTVVTSANLEPGDMVITARIAAQ